MEPLENGPFLAIAGGGGPRGSPKQEEMPLKKAEAQTEASAQGANKPVAWHLGVSIVFGCFKVW